MKRKPGKLRPPPDGERLQSPAELLRIDESTQCILCGACTYSCPSTWADPDYLGPAAMLKAYRFIFDSRDRAAEERLAIRNFGRTSLAEVTEKLARLGLGLRQPEPEEAEDQSEADEDA